VSPYDDSECRQETTVSRVPRAGDRDRREPAIDNVDEEYPAETTIDLTQMTVKELVAMAEEQGISTFKLRTKAQLLKALGA